MWDRMASKMIAKRPTKATTTNRKRKTFLKLSIS